MNIIPLNMRIHQICKGLFSSRALLATKIKGKKLLMRKKIYLFLRKETKMRSKKTFYSQIPIPKNKTPKGFILLSVIITNPFFGKLCNFIFIVAVFIPQLCIFLCNLVTRRLVSYFEQYFSVDSIFGIDILTFVEKIPFSINDEHIRRDSFSICERYAGIPKLEIVFIK